MSAFLSNLSAISNNFSLNSIAIGKYYDMPSSPNLSVSLKWEYGGSSHQTTYLGGSLSNTMWSKPPTWGDLPPWELLDATDIDYSVPVDDYKSGRRVWRL